MMDVLAEAGIVMMAMVVEPAALTGDLPWRPSPSRRVVQCLNANTKELIKSVGPDTALQSDDRYLLLDALNDLLVRRDFYRENAFAGVELPQEAQLLLSRPRELLSNHEVQRLNRLLLRAGTQIWKDLASHGD